VGPLSPLHFASSVCGLRRWAPDTDGIFLKWMFKHWQTICFISRNRFIRMFCVQRLCVGKRTVITQNPLIRWMRCRKSSKTWRYIVCWTVLGKQICSGHLVLCKRELIEAVLSIVVFWVVTPCGLIGGYQRFGGTCHFHFQRRSHFTSIFRVEVISTVKMDVIRSSELLVTSYKTTRRHNPEYHSRHLHRHENLKSQYYCFDHSFWKACSRSFRPWGFWTFHRRLEPNWKTQVSTATTVL
jgi:hypothetical protein